MSRPNFDGGYDPYWLGKDTKITLPKANSTLKDNLYQKDGNFYIYYPRHVILFNKTRKILVIAVTHLTTRYDHINFKRPSFGYNDRYIPKEFVIPAELYKHNNIDRSHAIKLNDLEYGLKGNKDSKTIIKKSLELASGYEAMIPMGHNMHMHPWNAIERVCKKYAADVTVFTFVITTPDDLFYRQIQIPYQAGKVVAYMKNGRLQAKVFLLENEPDFFKKEKEFQSAPKLYLTDFDAITPLNVDFDPTLVDACTFISTSSAKKIEIQSIDDLSF